MNDVSTTAELAAAAKTKVLVTDARGRVIVVHRLSVLDYYRLTKATGDTINDRTLNMAVIAAAVRRIDTLDFPFPSSEKDIEFVLQMLESDGFEAAAKGVGQLLPKADDGTEAAKNLAGNPPSS